MHGKAGAARRAARLARLLFGRNELRRRSDRIEGTILVTLWAAFLIAALATSVLGARVYQWQRAGAARLRPAVAVVYRTGPVDSLGGNDEVSARWRAPAGRELSGTLTLVTAPGIWEAAPGTRVGVWLTQAGEPVTPPASQALMIFDAVLVAIWSACGAVMALTCCYWLCRRALDRRRLAAWESAWALTGPRWTSRR
jgi:hypothetical protein